ncbi:ferredoxin [Nocardia vermiculata]|uniref:Ferredoxin n=1 Tax=Nocardia vermiculata TaxID=257274 RepID=A0A846Y7R3_9NOCA|nr:ferredoxin [Nocardia vermiculata]
MHVEVDRPMCVGSGQCVLTAPDVFDQDDNGIVTLVQERPGADQREVVEESAALCPAGAIRLAQ